MQDVEELEVEQTFEQPSAEEAPEISKPVFSDRQNKWLPTRQVWSTHHHMFQRIPIESLGTLASSSSDPLWDHQVKKWVKTKPCWCDRRLIWYPVPIKMWGIDLPQDAIEEKIVSTDDGEFLRDPQEVPHSNQEIKRSNLPFEMGIGPDDLASSWPSTPRPCSRQPRKMTGEL